MEVSSVDWEQEDRAGLPRSDCFFVRSMGGRYRPAGKTSSTKAIVSLLLLTINISAFWWRQQEWMVAHELASRSGQYGLTRMRIRLSGKASTRGRDRWPYSRVNIASDISRNPESGCVITVSHERVFPATASSEAMLYLRHHNAASSALWIARRYEAGFQPAILNSWR